EKRFWYVLGLKDCGEAESFIPKMYDQGKEKELADWILLCKWNSLIIKNLIWDVSMIEVETNECMTFVYHQKSLIDGREKLKCDDAMFSQFITVIGAFLRTFIEIMIEDIKAMVKTSKIFIYHNHWCDPKVARNFVRILKQALLV
ncbi:23994_t:CDS:2, partial [Gigaspora margarita]